MSSFPSPRLGKGLESLIPKNYISSGKTVTTIPIADIVANEFQPRLHFDQDALTTLAESIKTHGLAQPILVRRKGDKYELVAGERRFRACGLAGLDAIPAVVREMSDKESLQLALVENLDREDLNAIEEAKGYKRLIDEFDMTHQDVAQIFSKSRSAVSNTLRLLNLPAVVQDMVMSGELSGGHARALLSLGSEEEILAFLENLKSGEMTVRDVEKGVSASQKGGDKEEKAAASKSRYFQAVERELTDSVGVKVGIKGTKKKGRLTLGFDSQEQLDAILALLRNFKVPVTSQSSFFE